MGFGGWDIFVAEFVNGEWNNVENMMFPFNSAKDDFGYVMNRNNPKQGFLSTNRSGDGSVDAIFYVQPREQEPVVVESEPEILVEPAIKAPVEEPEPEPEPEPKVDLTLFPRAFSTILTSTFNGGAVEGATIEINDAFTGASVARGTSQAGGKISLDIPDTFRKEGQEFEIIITKPGDFQDKRVVANIMELEELGKGGIAITPVFSDTGLNEIGEMIIPYVGNEITSQGYQVLDKLAAFLINNPHVVIKLNGLTDARGNRLTNLNTSQSLAEKAEAYLLTKGVNDQNVIPRGYGERYLRNRCGRGKLCSEEQHLENRRIEVVVWRLLK